MDLRADRLTLETRECLLPGTRVALMRLSLDALLEADRHIINLFIHKGRGAPGLVPPGGR